MSDPQVKGDNEALHRREALQANALERYRRMVEIRLVEERVLSLFGEGLIPGTTHTCQGQEAVSVGIAVAARSTDTVACTYRSHGIALALGATPRAVLGEILGRQIGCMGGLGGSMHLSDITVGLLPTMAIVGAGIPIAVGVALSAQVRGTDDVAIAVFGDGAANIGAFHEGLNLAAIWNLPVVFICENNLYGEYSRIDRTTPVPDLAVRGGSYGIRSEVVDGQEVDAVAEAVGGAIGSARSGEGPSFIEAKTYRYAGHSRSDSAAYRPAGELDKWLERDPIALYGRKLIERGTATESELESVWEQERVSLSETLEDVISSPGPTPHQMLERVGASPR